jgi:membrane-associated protein
MSDQILSLLSLYGVPVLFGVLVVASAGVPLPVTLMLVAAGSFVAQGEMNFVPVLLLGSAGAILGDQIGYLIGRWGGRRVAHRASKWFGSEEKLKRAEETTRRWGGWGIFLSRWLITPLGPMVNITSGMAEYPWHRFLLFDALGEILWVVLYVCLGKIFSDRVEALGETLGDVSWVVIGLFAAIITGRKLLQYIRSDRAPKNQTLLKGSMAESKAS